MEKARLPEARARTRRANRRGSRAGLGGNPPPTRATLHEDPPSAPLIRPLANCVADEQWPVLRSLTADPSPLVRASAAEALGQHLDQPNTVALCKAAGDDYRLVRVRAATALSPVPEGSL